MSKCIFHFFFLFQAAAIFYFRKQEYKFNDYLNAQKTKTQCVENTTSPNQPSDTATTTETSTDSTTAAVSETSTSAPNPEDFTVTPGASQCDHTQNSQSSVNLTQEELDEMVKTLVAHLSVNTEDLSSVKRSKISAPDDRASSTTMGYFGITLIGVTFGTIIFLDIGKLVFDIRLAISNIRKFNV